MSEKPIHGNGNMLNQTKPLEYLLAICSVVYGANLLMNTATFELLVYKLMAELFSETRWGMLAVIMGTTRVVAVAVNGRVFFTPLIRCFMSIATGMFWLTLLVMMIASAKLFGAKLPAGVAYYPVFFLFEGWCVVSAAYDMKKNLMLRDATEKIQRLNSAPVSRER